MVVVVVVVMMVVFLCFLFEMGITFLLSSKLDLTFCLLHARVLSLSRALSLACFWFFFLTIASLRDFDPLSLVTLSEKLGSETFPLTVCGGCCGAAGGLVGWWSSLPGLQEGRRPPFLVSVFFR